jgi:hypothetical protein
VAIVRLDGLIKVKNPITSSGAKPATSVVSQATTLHPPPSSEEVIRNLIYNFSEKQRRSLNTELPLSLPNTSFKRGKALLRISENN